MRNRIVVLLVLCLAVLVLASCEEPGPRLIAYHIPEEVQGEYIHYGRYFRLTDYTIEERSEYGEWMIIVDGNVTEAYYDTSGDYYDYSITYLAPRNEYGDRLERVLSFSVHKYTHTRYVNKLW